MPSVGLNLCQMLKSLLFLDASEAFCQYSPRFLIHTSLDRGQLPIRRLPSSTTQPCWKLAPAARIGGKCSAHSGSCASPFCVRLLGFTVDQFGIPAAGLLCCMVFPRAPPLAPWLASREPSWASIPTWIALPPLPHGDVCRRPRRMSESLQ